MEGIPLHCDHDAHLLMHAAPVMTSELADTAEDIEVVTVIKAVKSRGGASITISDLTREQLHLLRGSVDHASNQYRELLDCVNRHDDSGKFRLYG